MSKFLLSLYAYFHGIINQPGAVPENYLTPEMTLESAKSSCSVVSDSLQAFGL